MAKIKWVKLSVDMFDNEKIKYLRKLPEGNNIVLVWIMLLTMAGRCNASGMIFLTENIPYTVKMLADELCFNENTVILALDQLERLGMIMNNQNYLMISGWSKHQNVEGMERIREQTRIRVAKHREKQKLLLGDNSDNSNEKSNVTVTLSNETERRKKKEERREKKEDIYIVSQGETIKAVVDYLNLKTGSNYRYQTEKTRKHIKARIAEGYTLDDFKTVIDKKADEWMNDEKMQKYLRPETLFGTKFEGYLNEKCSKHVNTGIPTGSKQDDLDEFF